jgi:hypothetical protein
MKRMNLRVVLSGLVARAPPMGAPSASAKELTRILTHAWPKVVPE